MKQDMAKDGSLSNLYLQMREQKALDRVLESAQVEEVEVPAAGEEKKESKDEKKGGHVLVYGDEKKDEKKKDEKKGGYNGTFGDEKKDEKKKDEKGK